MATVALTMMVTMTMTMLRRTVGTEFEF